MKRSLWTTAWVILALMAAQGLAGAQALSIGAISGFVEDETGARLPGATVTLESPAHIRPEAAVTDETGRYRFGNLSPGLYTLKVELAGFSSVVREGVRVDVGAEYRLDVTLKVAAVAETVTVVGESPVVDPKSSTVRYNYQYDFLQNIPQPRAGTGIGLLAMAPGVDATYSVAGSAGSGASAFVFDGVDVSDPGSGGQFPFYSYDYIEESQVITIGAPAEFGKFDGAIWNVVTKSGGTEIQGNANLYYTGDGLDADNITEINEQFASNPNFEPLKADKIEKRYDGTFTLGGPIEKNKLHFFGALQFIVDDTIEAGKNNIRTDRSKRYLGKLTWQASPQHRINGFYEFDSFPVDGRQPGGFLSPDPNTANREPSPNTTPRIHWQYTPNDRSLLEVQYSGFYGYFDLIPRNNLPGILDFGPYAIYQSYYGLYHFGRGRTEVKGDYSRFVDDFAGRHELKFGVGYEFGVTDDTVEYGKNSLGQNVLYYAYFGEIYGGDTRLGDEMVRTENKVLSLYAQDAWTIAERLTLNLGIRFDRGIGHWATPDEDAFTFNDVSPRLFATYDIAGNGKTVIRGGWGRFATKVYGNLYDDLDPSKPIRASFDFIGPSGGCGATVAGFPHVGGGPNCFAGLDAPNVETTIFRDTLATTGIDPDLKNHYVDQFAVGVERELFPDSSFAATYTHKEDGNLIGGRDTRAEFVPTTITDPVTGQPISVFTRLTPPDQIFQLLSNRDDIYHREYNGLELRWSKRYRNNWQLAGAWTIQKTEGNHDNDFNAPSLTGSLRGASPNDLVNSEGELLNSRRHVFKLQGTYRIPVVDSVVAVLYSYQSGRTYNRIVRARLPNRVDILAEPRGSRRLDPSNVLDFRFEKRFKFGGRRELGVLVDVFNIWNDAAITTINQTTGDSFELPLGVSSPRVVQFGVRWQF